MRPGNEPSTQTWKFHFGLASVKWKHLLLGKVKVSFNFKMLGLTRKSALCWPVLFGFTEHQLGLIDWFLWWVWSCNWGLLVVLLSCTYLLLFSSFLVCFASLLSITKKSFVTVPKAVYGFLVHWTQNLKSYGIQPPRDRSGLMSSCCRHTIARKFFLFFFLVFKEVILHSQFGWKYESMLGRISKVLFKNNSEKCCLLGRENWKLLKVVFQI